MKIKILGNNSSFLSAAPQLIKEFEAAGHEIVDENPDVLFHPTGFFDEVFKWAEKYPKALKVGCLLDADPTNPHWPEAKTKKQLQELDVKLTISNVAREQILSRTGEETEIVYYPIKPVSFLNYQLRGIDFLVTGRIYSSNKRFGFIEPFLNFIKFDKELLVTTGPEQPPFGFYTGILDNNMLNEMYNSARYLLFFSSHEGLGLGPIEAVICGCMPILCNDNKCIEELDLVEFSADPHPRALALKLKEMQENRDHYVTLINNLRPVFQEKFSAKKVAANILTAINKKI
jgi:glycosyltransferase involved in cell wall biosynthesis